MTVSGEPAPAALAEISPLIRTGELLPVELTQPLPARNNRSRRRLTLNCGARRHATGFFARPTPWHPCLIGKYYDVR
jgi:hypothetical protein